MSATTSEYIPGVCNIGPAEIRRRRASGWIGVAIAVVFLVAAFALQLPAPWRLLVAAPVGLAAGGFLQAAFHFCANFAMRGLFNFDGVEAAKEEVSQREYRRKDQRKALLIVGLALLIAVVVAVAAFLIPLP